MYTTCVSKSLLQVRARSKSRSPFLPLLLHFFLFCAISTLFPLSFSPHNTVKYPSAADYRKQQLRKDFSIPLSSFTFVLSCRFDSRFGGMFEAISEMTCFAHIFKHFPFVMQMVVTPSIRRKADACYMDCPGNFSGAEFWLLWRIVMLSACDGVVLGTYHAGLWFSTVHHNFDVYHASRPQIEVQGTCSTSVCAAPSKSFTPPSASYTSCSAPLTVARCLPTATQRFISRPPDRRWCNCSLHWSVKPERKAKKRKKEQRTHTYTLSVF